MNCRKDDTGRSGRCIFAAPCFALMLVFVSTGCAGFSGKLLPKAEPFTGEFDEKITVILDVSFQASLNGKPVNIGRKLATKGLRNEAIKEFEKSGVFTIVEEPAAHPDLRVKIDMKDIGEGSMGMAFLTGLTLYIVPSKATDTYVLTATVQDSSGQEVAQYELTDSVTQWQEILLLPLMPFKMTPLVASGVRKNMLRTLIHRMIDDEVVQKIQPLIRQ